MAMPMNTAVNSVNTYACTDTTMSSSAEMPTASGTRQRPTPMPTIALAEQLGEDEHERQDRQDRDVAAGHVGRKSHRQRERPHEHAHDLDRDQQRSSSASGRPCGTMFFQCLTKPCARMPATMMAKNVIVASAAVTLKLPVARHAAVQHLREERLFRQVQHRVVEQRQHVEDRDQADRRWRRG